MSTSSSLPTYSEINAALKSTPGRFNASQVHGLMCGLICATTGANDVQWDRSLGIKKDSSPYEMLQNLYETSYHQMNEFSFEFSLVLPQDKADINKRTEALGLWCQGFLTGLDQGKVQIQNRPADEITETLNDLIEISQVTYGDLTATDEDETAYFELVEYVRLAALMVFHELRPSDSAPLDEDNNNVLH